MCELFYPLKFAGTGAANFAISSQPPAPSPTTAATAALQIETNAVLDFETATTHSFNVEVTDGSNTATVALTVNVGDVNDNPVCSPNTHFKTLAENSAAGEPASSSYQSDYFI